MNRALGAVVIWALVSLPMDRGHAQGALPVPVARDQPAGLKGGIVFVGNSARTVTVRRNGTLLSSFTFPVGTFLSVTYDDQKPNSVAAARWTFQGDVVLRALPANEPGVQGANRIEQVVNQAPLELTVRGGDVVIENMR